MGAVTVPEARMVSYPRRLRTLACVAAVLGAGVGSCGFQSDRADEPVGSGGDQPFAEEEIGELADPPLIGRQDAGEWPPLAEYADLVSCEELARAQPRLLLLPRPPDGSGEVVCYDGLIGPFDEGDQPTYGVIYLPEGSSVDTHDTGRAIVDGGVVILHSVVPARRVADPVPDGYQEHSPDGRRRYARLQVRDHDAVAVMITETEMAVKWFEPLGRDDRYIAVGLYADRSYRSEDAIAEMAKSLESAAPSS
jgi:hypothetical protein